MRKINVLYCIEYLSSGGTERQLISLIDGLNRNNFQAHLCCLRNSMIGRPRRKEALHLFGKMECPKIQLDFGSLRKIQSLIEIVKLIRFIKEHKIDIVQTYFQDPTLLGVLAAKLSGVKHVIACFRDMGFWHQTEKDWKMKIVYKLCSAYIANSYAVRNLYMSLYSLPDYKFSVIHNGIDAESFASIRKRARTEDKPTRVGIVANLNREVKRVDIFLRAAADVAEKVGGIKFVVIGHGELTKDLIALSEDLGIARHVEFVGQIKDIPKMLAKIHIGVISSDSEGFSNAILEYMAAGVPVVATDVGGNSEIIKNGVNGFLVPRGDYHSMAEKILELASTKYIYQKMKENALKTIYKRYTLKHCIERYESYYETFALEKC